MGQRLAGKVAIVTGGAGSIGRQHSLLFASEGAKVVVNDLGLSAVGDGEMAQANASFDPEARPPRKVSPFVVWLCTDAASHVNGRSFHVYGDFVSLYREPDDERTIFASGGWDLDTLDAAGPQLTAGLTNDYTLDDHPDLQVFKD